MLGRISQCSKVALLSPLGQKWLEGTEDVALFCTHSTPGNCMSKRDRVDHAAAPHCGITSGDKACQANDGGSSSCTN